ncbi:MAG TPA: hypothetical protein VG329_09310 [Candidatus Dormibacteraeota bacterium]|jgi:hypothetical protein|nr:hypothetical protein [Candidatus Dormibacteraeota bacterium]
MTRPRIEHAAVVAGVAYLVLAVVLHPRWTMDDAYISLRFATNLAQHGQLAWNLTGSPVEGYTGVLLPLLLAAAIRVSLPALQLTEALNAVAVITSGVLVYAILRLHQVHRWLTLGAVLVFCLNPFLPTQALSGLETGLFMLGLTAAVWLFARLETVRGAGWANEVALGIALLLTCLARPEGVLLAAAALTALVFLRRRQGRPWLASTARVGLTVAVPGVSYLAWTNFYYGGILPNTFYVKAGTAGTVGDSAVAIVVFVLASLALPVVAGWSLARTPPGPVRRPLTATLALAVGGALLVSYLRADLIQNIGFRFFVPALPLILVGLALVLDRRHRDGFRLTGAARYVAVGTLVVQLLASLSLLGARRAQDAAYGQLIMDEHKPAGDYIAATVPRNAVLAVCVDAGAIPYYSGLDAIDMGGLNDRHLARDHLTLAQKVDYLFSRRPQVIVLTSDAPDRSVGGPDIAGAVGADPRLAGYRLARSFGTRASGWEHYYQLVYLSRDMPG